MKQNYPNPFNASTTVEFSLPKTTNVRLKIFDLSGKEIVLLFDEKKPPGTYKYLYYANKLSSGVYFYCLETDYGIQTKRMILLK
ncbi:MAG TPA: T9SS type A sorting domain-containing protein [Ignavibacteria bacterium]|nr:T9SS type A sorting domain-containing protein [Ignavibacteria bacterium]